MVLMILMSPYAAKALQPYNTLLMFVDIWYLWNSSVSYWPLYFTVSSQTDAHLLLSGRHIDQLLRNLDDSATLLKNVLKNSARFPQDTTALSGVCSSRFRGLCNYSTRSVLWVTAGIQVLPLSKAYVFTRYNECSSTFSPG